MVISIPESKNSAQNFAKNYTSQVTSRFPFLTATFVVYFLNSLVIPQLVYPLRYDALSVSIVEIPTDDGKSVYQCWLDWTLDITGRL